MLPIENDEEPSARWNRTTRAIDRVEWAIDRRRLPGYGTVEYFMGHHVIGRDRPILNGVYLGSYAREAIVVTDDRELREAYAELRSRTGRLARPRGEDRVLRVAHDLVREYMPSGTVKTDALIARLLPHGACDQKIALSVFVAERTGVCRHRALFLAYLIERLIADRFLAGRVSVDRNETDEGGHAWIRFTSSRTGRILISDPGLGPCGDLYAIKKEWSYKRPEDPSSPPPKPSPTFDELDYAVAVAIVAAATWWLVH